MSELLDIRGVVKRCPGVMALRGVDLRLAPGEVLAVLGENGAGKSTLMKILAGVQPADEGEFLIDGKPVEIHSVQGALEHGIALIHQELNLATNLDVAANIFLGRERLKGGFLDDAAMRKEARQYLEMVGLKVDPATMVGDLAIGRQQLVEIAKALSVDARVLIMDEPTSSLSQGEAERLFKVIADLRDRGVSIVYISHRLGEIVEIADRVTVLRDGENAGELEQGEITHDHMVRLMVGRDVSQFYQRIPHEAGEVALEVRGARTQMYPEHAASFTVRSGEVVGMAGLVGAGRTELAEALFGVRPLLDGEVLIEGQPVQITSPRESIAAGLALVPEDRKRQGVILDMAVSENTSLASLRRDQRPGGFLDRAKERELTATAVKDMRIKTPGDWQVVRFLSGGNQQKVVLGKWLALKPKVLVLDEPTRGVDVGAKQEIYGLIEELARDGVAVLFVSSEMEEVMGMADRVLVMHEGEVTGELSREELTEERIMALATGSEATLEHA